MKESEFIELLNLYLDHEISAADAARLETEVQSNPGRRMVYQEYCRMQKACKLLVSDFKSEGVAAETATERNVVAFDPVAASAAAARRGRSNWMLATGGLAAACIALVAMNRGTNTAPSGNAPINPVGQVSPSPAREVNVPADQVTVTKASKPLELGRNAQRTRPVLVSDSLTLTGNTNSLLIASDNEANEQFKWIGALQIAPLDPRPENLRFDVQPATLRPDARTLHRTRTRTDGTVEMSAFRFEK